MSYTNATFCLDLESGSDTARANLVPTAYANNGSGLVRITCNNPSAYTPASGCDFVVDIAGTTGSVYVGAWKATIIDSTHIDLQGSTFSSNPASKGTCTPRGGASKSDAWLTYNSGATSSRVTSGDTVRVKGTAAPWASGVNGVFTDAAYDQTELTGCTATNATPINIGKNAHGRVNGDIVVHRSFATNTFANGVFIVSNATTNAYDILFLDGTNTTGNGAGTGGISRKITGACITLASAITQNIALCGNLAKKPNWTASANVTCTQIGTGFVNLNDWQEGFGSVQIVPAAAFATGKAAYYTLPAALDLSSYQQVSLWVKGIGGAGVMNRGDLSIRLCSDTTGDVSINTIPLPALSSSFWTAVSVNYGSALHSNVQSIALYVDVDSGATNFLLDNIVASPANGPTVGSMIGKSTSSESGPEFWWPIKFISGKVICIEQGNSATNMEAQPPRGYCGVSETVQVYFRRCYDAITASAVTAINPQFTQIAGVHYIGGYDRTNMTTVDGETWINGQNWLNTVYAGNVDSWSSRHIHFWRFLHMKAGATCASVTYDGCIVNCSFNGTVTSGDVWGSGFSANWSHGPNEGHHLYCMQGGNNSTGLFDMTFLGTAGGHTATGPATIGNVSVLSCGHDTVGNNVPSFTLTASTTSIINGTIRVINCSEGGLTLNGGLIRWPTATGAAVECRNNRFFGVIFSVSRTRFSSVIARNCTTNILFVGDGNVILGGAESGASTAAFQSASYQNYFRNFTVASSTVLTTPTAFSDARINVEELAGVFGDNRIYADGGSIVSQTTTRHTASGVAWQFSPTSTNRSATYPLSIPLATFAVKANKAITLSCWIRRDDTATLVAKLIVPGFQIAGIAADVSVTASGAINTWTQETLATMTPTEDGVIQVYAQVYGGTTLNAYFDDISIVQAA